MTYGDLLVAHAERDQRDGPNDSGSPSPRFQDMFVPRIDRPSVGCHSFSGNFQLKTTCGGLSAGRLGAAGLPSWRSALTISSGGASFR
jgi:hypothetical protein